MAGTRYESIERDHDLEQDRQELGIEGPDAQYQFFPRENPLSINAQLAACMKRTHAAPDIRPDADAQKNTCKKD
jgi:hypothetical protein